MTKMFDKLCGKIIGENIVTPTTQQPNLSATATKAINPQQPNQNQNQQTPQQPTQPTQQQQQNNGAPKDDDLLKLLQQKLADEKFKQSLMQLLNQH